MSSWNRLQTALADGPSGAVLCRKSTRFGFRETWFEGIHFCLNGIRCNRRGESPAYAEKTDLFATRETATEMIRRCQAANCNVLRFHSMPAPPHVLEVCEELGMLVIDESAIYASWQMLMPEHPDWMEHCREHLTRWVRRDRNHPSVILWSAENEGLNVSALTPAMLYADGRRKDQWSEGGSVPDMSQLETRRWFLLLAAACIDLGVEAIHFGQVEIMDERDKDHAHWRGLLTRVRAYAAQHARRHFILCDAHVPSGGIVHDGRLLLDFHSFPLRIAEVSDKPQEGVLKRGHLDTIYGRSKGGLTPTRKRPSKPSGQAQSEN